MTLRKHTYTALFIVTLILTALLTSCKDNSVPKEIVQDDVSMKKMLQGMWVNDLEGNVVFAIKGDSIFYGDSLSNPTSFRVYGDTIYVENHMMVKYPVKKLTASSLCIINADGDEVELVKSDQAMKPGEYRGSVNPIQGRVVKVDTVVICGNHRYHAYSQVNPTSYKVYNQTTNSDGLTVENIYFDNIVHIAVYEGSRRIFGHNIKKEMFAKHVPTSYLEKAVLSEILIEGAKGDDVEFVAILSMPDSYTNYRVNIIVSPDGKYSMSL